MLDKLFQAGLVPVIQIEDASQAGELAQALCRGGLPVAEVTMRTPAAVAAIREMRYAQPEMVVGAGTVLTMEQLERALEAGAQFIVSPCFNEKIVAACMERGTPVLPGCSTVSEVDRAREMGLSVVKFFPAQASGGVQAIKAIAAPYVGMRFMPTGGVSLDNLHDYLSCSQVVCCGGSFMVPGSLLRSGDVAGIERLTRAAVKEMLGLQIRSLYAAQDVSLLPSSPATQSLFQTCEENKVLLTAAHLSRAKDYFRLTGVEFDEVKNGIRLRESFGGLAVYIEQEGAC